MLASGKRIVQYAVHLPHIPKQKLLFLGKICCSSDREASGTLFNYANIFLSGQL